MKCRFSVRSHVLYIAVNLGKRFCIFVCVVAEAFTLSFVLRIVLTKINNYIIPFFLI